MPSSLSFEGNEGSYISFPYDPSMNIGASTDFTVEWFQYQTDDHTWPRIFQRGVYPGTLGVSIEGGTFYLWLSGANSLGDLTSYKNTWVHFAISRNSGIIRVFMNGVQIGTSINNNNSITSTNNLVLGNESVPSLQSAYGGYIYTFNWVHGVGKYPGNFTVPTTFNIDNNTLLFITGDETYGKLAPSIVKNKVSTSTQVPEAFQIIVPDMRMIPYIQAQQRPVLSNNLIFYKPGSLASCGVGGSANSRTKSRRT